MVHNSFDNDIRNMTNNNAFNKFRTTTNSFPSRNDYNNHNRSSSNSSIFRLPYMLTTIVATMALLLTIRLSMGSETLCSRLLPIPTFGFLSSFPKYYRRLCHCSDFDEAASSKSTTVKSTSEENCYHHDQGIFRSFNLQLFGESLTVKIGLRKFRFVRIFRLPLPPSMPTNTRRRIPNIRDNSSVHKTTTIRMFSDHHPIQLPSISHHNNIGSHHGIQNGM